MYLLLAGYAFLLFFGYSMRAGPYAASLLQKYAAAIPYRGKKDTWKCLF